uniref:FHA domain-containing protein n=1 Tax=Anopheles minimus TaxID=112268 RepID=A0A182VS05_9DIPT
MFSVRGAHIFVFTNENAENSSKIEVKSNRVTIGAHPLNNIRLHTLNAERLHCKIFADSASSRNPISVNGVIVERTAKLHDNDRFEVAGTIFLWNFDPVHIRAVSKQSKRPIMQRRRKTITLKRIRSTGDITKQSFVTVPRAVGLMLNEYRKRRTIHSTMSEQFHKASSRPAGLCDDSVDSTNHTNALDDLSTQALLNVTPSDLTSCITPLIEKENIVPGRIKDRNISSSKRTPHISAAKKRHLACHTPVSPLIDLTTPPAKSRATTIARKALSAKAVQSPRLPDVVNIVTPSPKKINRTPSSSKAVASTPKTTLLRSAIKNSRTHEMEAKTLSVSSISIKKTPHTKMNTSSTNTPKLTPVASKSSSVKIRKHLISTLSEKKSGTLLKTDSPVPIINAGRFSKHSTPTVGKGHRTPKGGISSVTPKIQHPVPYNIPVVVIESNANNENDVAADCVSIEPIVDVQSVIKKPNRTTQIRSAKYSDITPHESFVDGLMPLALPPEESVQALQTESIPAPANMFQDELKSINYKTTNFNVNRNSCSSIVATVLTGLPETRKTMNEFSSDLCGSPLRRLVKPHLQLNEDSTKDVESLANDVDEDALLTSSALEPPVQTDVISTPELRHSWRHTRKCIGSAFTSLNTSRPQLDLTAEIDESLVFIEDEETPLESNELYNMECSKASFTVEQHIDLHHPTVNNLEAAQTVPEAFTETDSILIADVLPERSYEEQTAADSYDKEKYQQTAEQMEAVPESTAELVLESMTDIHCGLEQEDVNMDPLEKVPESASEVVLESVTDIRCGSGQEVEGNMILTET